MALLWFEHNRKQKLQDSETNQGENKEVVKYGISKKCSDWSGRTLQIYKDKEKIETKIGIISMFTNETKIDIETSVQIDGEYRFISTFRVKKNKQTEELKT